MPIHIYYCWPMLRREETEKLNEPAQNKILFETFIALSIIATQATIQYLRIFDFKSTSRW